MSASVCGTLLCVLIAIQNILALDIPPRNVHATLVLGDASQMPHPTDKNVGIEEKEDTTHSLEGPALKELPQSKMIERRMDHHEVTHGVGYSTHLNPQYYQGNDMGKYYDCALQGPWKPIQGHYEHRVPSATVGVAQNSEQHHHPHHHHHHPPADHHHEHTSANDHGGNAFGTNYVEEWDQRLKEVLRGTPLGNHHGGGGHRDVGVRHHGRGPEFGQKPGGYRVTSHGFGGSGTRLPFSGLEDHPEGHHSAEIVHGHHGGVEGGQGIASFHTDFPYQFDSANEWLQEQPYDESASNDEAHGGFPLVSGNGDEGYQGMNAFQEAVKNIGDIRYTHAIFGLVDPQSQEEGVREGAASHDYRGDEGEGSEQGDDHHHGGYGAGSSEAEEVSGDGGHPQGHAAPNGGAGSFKTGEGYAVDEVQGDEGAEHSNPLGDYAGSSTGEGAEPSGDFNGGVIGGNGDFSNQDGGAINQLQPSHQSSQSGYTGGHDAQVLTHPHPEMVLGGGGGGGNLQTPVHHAPAGVHQYETPPPRCPYADHPHNQAVSVANVIHSLPYDEGVQANHLQVMMPPKLQHHVKLLSVLPVKQYEVHENQEESENKETVVDGTGRPAHVSTGQHVLLRGERPLSDDHQQGLAGETFAEPNKVVDGSGGFPTKPVEGDDFLRPPPLVVTDHYAAGNGHFKGFSDGRRKRPFGRPSSHSGMPHVALFRRPPSIMMRTRPVIRGPIKRLSFA